MHHTVIFYIHTSYSYILHASYSYILHTYVQLYYIHTYSYIFFKKISNTYIYIYLHIFMYTCMYTYEITIMKRAHAYYIYKIFTRRYLDTVLGHCIWHFSNTSILHILYRRGGISRGDICERNRVHRLSFLLDR